MRHYTRFLTRISFRASSLYRVRSSVTAEEVRAYCKLTIGIPILRAESELFAQKYDEHIRRLPYETKLAMMAEPFDFPVTRLMTTAQKTRYLDEVQRHFGAQGVVFSSPLEVA